MNRIMQKIPKINNLKNEKKRILNKLMIILICQAFFIMNYSGFADTNNLISLKAQNNQDQDENEHYSVTNEDIIYKNNIKNSY